MKCESCGTNLIGKQQKFCSIKCKHKEKDKRRQQRPARRKRVNFNRRERAIKRKAELVLLLGGKCEKCTYDDNLACLSFHHRDPSQKEFVLTLQNIIKHSMDVIIKEARKCQLLCIRCHFDVEWPQFRDWKTQKPVS